MDLNSSPRLRAPAATARHLLRTLARAASLALCLAAVGPAWGADAQPAAPPAAPAAASAAASAAAGLKQARALIRAGQFDKALAILRPLLRGGRVEAGVLFNIGVAAAGAARKRGISGKRRDALLDEAIAIFRAMLVHRPGLVRVRLELARAFFFKGEDTLARRHFERVLAGKPPAAVVGRRQPLPRRRCARASAGASASASALAPDSNISARTDDADDPAGYTPIGRLPFTYRSDDRPTSGIGVAVWAGGEYQYPLARRWRLRMGGDISRPGIPVGRVRPDVRGRAFRPALADFEERPRRALLASARLSWLSDEMEYRDLGLRFEGRRRLNRRIVDEPQRLVARPPLPGARLARRAARGPRGGDRLGGDADRCA